MRPAHGATSKRRREKRDGRRERWRGRRMSHSDTALGSAGTSSRGIHEDPLYARVPSANYCGASAPAGLRSAAELHMSASGGRERGRAQD